jgi:phosphatidylglycerophosphate synthase
MRAEDIPDDSRQPVRVQCYRLGQRIDNPRRRPPTMETRLTTASRITDFIGRADSLRRRTDQSPGLLWSRNVNRRIGGLITLALLDSRVTPNMVTMASLACHLLGAVVVLTAPAPAPLGVVLGVFVIWQFAFALDCTDGQLARVRGIASPFGAWLDQVLDHVAHTAVICALVVFVVRGMGLPAAESAALGAIAVGCNLISFAAAQRNALLGTTPAVDASRNPRLAMLIHTRQLTDHGVFLALASIALVSPPLLLIVIAFFSVATAGVVLGQVALNWVAISREG